MDIRFNRLPGQARFWAVLAVWLIPPALAFAQQEPAGPSSNPAAPAAADPQAGSYCGPLGPSAPFLSYI